MNISQSELIRILEHLDNHGIVAYAKRKDKPQITFLTERYDAGRLPLNTKRIEERRKNAISKAASMIAYIKEDGQCRATQISNYFGEESEAECGICDVCIEKKKALGQRDEKLKQRIIQTLKEGLLFSIQSIQEVPGLKNDKYTLRVLREMEEEGLIFCEPEGIYKLNN